MLTSRTHIWCITAVLFTIICVGGICAHTLGWYHEFWFADIVLHTLSGVMLGLFWIGLTYKETVRSNLVFLLAVVMAGVFGSYVWELWEFGGAYILPGIAIAYAPDLRDCLSDIACGMVGGLLVGGIYLLTIRKR